MDGVMRCILCAMIVIVGTARADGTLRDTTQIVAKLSGQTILSFTLGKQEALAAGVESALQYYPPAGGKRTVRTVKLAETPGVGLFATMSVSPPQVNLAEAITSLRFHALVMESMSSTGLRETMTSPTSLLFSVPGYDKAAPSDSTYLVSLQQKKLTGAAGRPAPAYLERESFDVASAGVGVLALLVLARWLGRRRNRQLVAEWKTVRQLPQQSPSHWVTPPSAVRHLPQQSPSNWVPPADDEDMSSMKSAKPDELDLRMHWLESKWAEAADSRNKSRGGAGPGAWMKSTRASEPPAGNTRERGVYPEHPFKC